jgi:hypothetical protein
VSELESTVSGRCCRIHCAPREQAGAAKLAMSFSATVRSMEPDYPARAAYQAITPLLTQLTCEAEARGPSALAISEIPLANKPQCPFRAKIDIPSRMQTLAISRTAWHGVFCAWTLRHSLLHHHDTGPAAVASKHGDYAFNVAALWRRETQESWQLCFCGKGEGNRVKAGLAPCTCLVVVV